MSTDRTIPHKQKDTSIVTYTIKVDGSEVNVKPNTLAIMVHKEINRIPVARLVFRDGDTSTEEFELSSKAEFIPGKEIEILAGYSSEDDPIFKGVITRHSVKVRSSGNSMLVVECRDKAVKMTIGRKNAYYYEKLDSAIIEELIKAGGATAKVEATKVTHKEMVQYFTTDWDFMMTRAEANSSIVIVNDGEVNVGPPDLSNASPLTLTYGATILEFDGEIDARYQLDAVMATSWDPAQQKVVEGTGKDPGAPKTGNLSEKDLAAVASPSTFELYHSGQITDAELEAWADGQLLKSRMAKVQGSVKHEGFADVQPGQTVELAGLGDRFNGTAYIGGVRHEIGDGTWFTTLELGLSPRWFYVDKADVFPQPASGVLPGITGLQIGIVTALEGDPDGEDRMQVQIPVIDKVGDGTWARVATLDAGDDRGSFFRPEIGDEVVIGFLNDDPRNPIVLGAMNSSAKPAPLKASDKNDEKGFFTRSKMKVLFNDKDSIITIETPGGNSIVVDDKGKQIALEDLNGNTITMDSSGITAESPKNITLKATGDLVLEGMNVNVKAQAQFKAEGAAGAEVSTSAVAVLKGSLVQIN